jgi:hypothetical protein
MRPPSAHDIAVATGALRTEADTWSAQASVLAGMSIEAQALAFDRLQAGVFQLIATTHADLTAAVAARCAEGAGQMRQIAATLHHVADVYDDEERRHVHAFRHLY